MWFFLRRIHRAGLGSMHAMIACVEDLDPVPGSRSAQRMEDTMISWIAGIFLAAGGIVAGWFVAKDASNFGVVQMMMALILLTLVVAVGAFWPARWTISLNRLPKVR